MRNPIITSIYTADPSAHVWDDGRLYIYASHDVDPARGCDLMDKYHVFSTDDMINWTDEGEILSSDDDEWGRPEGGFMWAPDCAYKNGKYYFYYPHPSGSDWNNTWKIGVAVSNHPAKGFKDQGYIDGLGGFALIDPCVFTDDDNKSYMYYGGGSKAYGGELADDMVSLKGEMLFMDGLEDFHEAAWIFKRNGIYYFTYADNNHGKNMMRYSISKNPLGPWEYKGVFLEPTGCDTTHGSVAEYKGQWYLFYHNQTISGHGNLRSVCIDKLYFNDDGTIKTVVQTSDGIIPQESLTGAKIYNAPSDCVISDDSVCEFENIDGGNGGRAAIYIRYRTEEKLSKLNLIVNGKDYSFLNALATDEITKLTVTLSAGETNKINLIGKVGKITVEAVAVRILD